MQRPFVKTSRLLALLLFTIISSLSSAAMYKWVDEDGNTVYSQNPPPGDIEAETIKPPPPPPVDSSDAWKNVEAKEEKATKLREERLKKDEEKSVAEKNKAIEKENCRRAHDAMTNLQNPRAKIAQPDGSRMRLDEEQRQQELKKAQAMIDEWCK